MAISSYSQIKMDDSSSGVDLRYALSGNSWAKSTLTYYINHTYAPQLTTEQRNTAIQQAIQKLG
jgi:hypothetical protein